MSAEVKVLIKGYTSADSVADLGEELTQPTITLIKDDGLVIIVDPGIIKNQNVLVSALKKHNLSINDVNVVCITHSHLDHYRNVGMFPNAKVLEYFGLWEGNAIHDWNENFSTNINIIRTPGHDYSAITLFVKTDPKSDYPGIIAICGDNFWKENYPERPEDDPFASDCEKLKQSREIILKTADWIIPGHAGIYKNEKKDNYLDQELIIPKKELKNILICKKCKVEMKQSNRCLCRPNLCFRCCECGFDCPACGCSHKK